MVFVFEIQLFKRIILKKVLALFPMLYLILLAFRVQSEKLEQFRVEFCGKLAGKKIRLKIEPDSYRATFFRLIFF